MPEIRLGALPNLVNVNLGSVETQEIYLGQALVWRNNLGPFFNLTVNGTVVDTNGTPMSPERPDTPANAVLSTFQYTDNITIGVTGVQDEEMQYPVVFNLYEGDFDQDDTLTSISTDTVANANGSGTLTFPRGPQPTGSNAGDFIFTDRLYSVVGVDAEEGESIIYFRITRTDSTDQFVLGGFSNVGGTFNPRTSSSSQNLSNTINTQCFDQVSTTIFFTRTTTTPIASQLQRRSCSVQVVGIQDTPPLVCTSAQTDQTITVTTGSSSSSDTETSRSNFNNPNFVASRGTATGSRTFSTTSTSDGTCQETAGRPGCGTTATTCTQTGTAVRTTTVTTFSQPTNCAGEDVGSATETGRTSSTTNVSCSYSYPNPTFVSPPDPPTFSTATCTFTCSGGASVSGGSATISPGQSGTRTCVSGGLTSSSTSGTCPAATTGHRLILRAPSGFSCAPTDTQRWSWMCSGNSRSAVLRVGDSEFSGCIDPDTTPTSTFRSNVSCFGSSSVNNSIDCTC